MKFGHKKTERGRDRQTDRQRQTETERETERQRDRDRKRQRERQRETERQRQRETETETDRDRQGQTETDRDCPFCPSKCAKNHQTSDTNEFILEIARKQFYEQASPNDAFVLYKVFISRKFSTNLTGLHQVF